VIARIAGVGAIVAAVVVIGLLLLTGGSPYALNADFRDAGGLVGGNLVMMGPAQVGTVNSITLTPNGLAQVGMSLNSNA
jgi:ABC-type transporter Mla subunit MlaD